jgi:hypothetical protein
MRIGVAEVDTKTSPRRKELKIHKRYKTVGVTVKVGKCAFEA